MVGLFGTLGTATSGMGANQIALQTSSHNIANTNTDGYSRQRVDMKTTTPYNMAGVGMIGTGVEANGVERVVNDFVRSQIREANAQYQFYNEKSDVLGQLEDTLNEPLTAVLSVNCPSCPIVGHNFRRIRRWELQKQL